MKTKQEIEAKIEYLYIELEKIAKQFTGKSLTLEQSNAVNQLAGQVQALEWILGIGE